MTPAEVRRDLEKTCAEYGVHPREIRYGSQFSEGLMVRVALGMWLRRMRQAGVPAVSVAAACERSSRMVLKWYQEIRDRERHLARAGRAA